MSIIPIDLIGYFAYTAGIILSKALPDSDADAK